MSAERPAGFVLVSVVLIDSPPNHGRYLRIPKIPPNDPTITDPT